MNLSVKKLAKEFNEKYRHGKNAPEFISIVKLCANLLTAVSMLKIEKFSEWLYLPAIKQKMANKKDVIQYA